MWLRLWLTVGLTAIAIAGSLASLWAIRGDLKMIPPSVIWGFISLGLFISVGIIAWWLYSFEKRFYELQGRIHTTLEQAEQRATARMNNRIARIEAKLGMRPLTAGQEPPEGGGR